MLPAGLPAMNEEQPGETVAVDPAAFGLRPFGNVVVGFENSLDPIPAPRILLARKHDHGTTIFGALSKLAVPATRTPQLGFYVSERL